VQVNSWAWGLIGGVVLAFIGCGDSEHASQPDGAAGMVGGIIESGGGPAAAGARPAAEAGSTSAAGKGGDSGTGGSPVGGGPTGATTTGGSAGTATGGSAGEAAGGSAGAPLSQHCTPGKTIQSFPYDIVQPCYGDQFRFHLPNGYNSSVRDFRLDAPTTAGERFAFSVRHVGIGPYAIEVWGSNEQCGVAKELLWSAPMKTGIQCAEFVPTASYSHLFYVYRKLYEMSYSFSAPELTLCQAGTCPAGAEGQGLGPGVTVTPAALVYDDSGGNSDSKVFDLRLGIRGRAVLLPNGTKQPKGTANTIKQGFLRMPADDRFGDAWYCVGSGSTIVQSAANDTYTASLKNLTRLPSCDAPGSGTASFVIAQTGVTITSSFADLPIPNPTAKDQSCLGPQCALLFLNYETVSMRRWLYVTPQKSVADDSIPTAVPTAITEATLFSLGDPTLPISISCARSGTITYDPAGTTSVSLEALSNYYACPGEPVAANTLEFTTL